MPLFGASGYTNFTTDLSVYIILYIKHVHYIIQLI